MLDFVGPFRINVRGVRGTLVFRVLGESGVLYNSLVFQARTVMGLVGMFANEGFGSAGEVVADTGPVRLSENVAVNGGELLGEVVN